MGSELKAYLDAIREDLTEQISGSRRHAEQLNRETCVIIEDVRHQIQMVAEGVTTVRNQLGRVLADHETRITNLERRIP